MEIVDCLLDSGAHTEIKNDDGDTALMLAVRSEHAAVVDALCKRGCDLHAQGFDNIDPLDYAKNKKNLYLSDVLLKHDAVSRQNSQSSTHSGSQQQQHHRSSAFSDRNNSILELDEEEESGTKSNNRPSVTNEGILNTLAEMSSNNEVFHQNASQTTEKQ